jgi:hypothetical protein
MVPSASGDLAAPTIAAAVRENVDTAKYLEEVGR